MARPRSIPAYRLHKPSGLAVVRIDGHDHYLGGYDSPESREKYHRLIAEHLSDRLANLPRRPVVALLVLTVSEMLARYRTFAQVYYVKNGQPTKELTDMKYAARALRELYGSLLVTEFGPLKLKDLRAHLVAANLSRGVINQRINRVKRIFKWAVSEELAPSSVYESLRTVVGLKYGRTAARETEPIRPVDDIHVEATLACLGPITAAMVRIQRLTGMRPCEVTAMRLADINQTDSVWVYTPADHKNRWRGHVRQIPLGPQVQATLTPFLDRDSTVYLFSPAEAEELRHHQRRQSRRSPMTPSQSARRPKAKPARPKRDRYDTDSYRRAIEYAIRSANRTRRETERIPLWCPLQLRHSRATEIRKRYGLEGAQVSLGHSRADVTQVYAERDLELARRIAGETG